MTRTVVSSDGTRIVAERQGTGPPVLLIDGAFCYRGFGPMPKLGPALAAHHAVTWYDRRGRGESGGAGGTPDAVEREIEDIRALLDDIGEPTFVYGTSSGAALALRAVARMPEARGAHAVPERRKRGASTNRYVTKRDRSMTPYMVSTSTGTE